MVQQRLHWTSPAITSALYMDFVTHLKSVGFALQGERSHHKPLQELQSDKGFRGPAAHHYSNSEGFGHRGSVDRIIDGFELPHLPSCSMARS